MLYTEVIVVFPDVRKKHIHKSTVWEEHRIFKC